MNKNFITTLIAGAILLPAFASAQATSTVVTITPTMTTTAQIFTACTQTSIQRRDTTISAARTTYNTAMTKALSDRKEAEKAVLVLTDEIAKRSVLKTANDSYKNSIKQAQTELDSARKEALSSFEKDTKGCREINKDTRETKVLEKKAEVEKKKEVRKEAVEIKKTEIKQIQAEHKAEVEIKKEEIKTLRQNLQTKISALRSFFAKKTAVKANATVNVNSTTTVSQ